MTTFENLPRRIFLDSCTAQTLRDYGNYVYEAEPIHPGDRIYKITDGIANLEALRNIFAVSERAMFEWIVSRGSMEEVTRRAILSGIPRIMFSRGTSSGAGVVPLRRSAVS
jgi:hypothetical protein